MESNKLELVFTVEKDTKNTRRYKEEATDGPPVIGTLYVQQWAPVLNRTGTGRCVNSTAAVSLGVSG